VSDNGSQDAISAMVLDLRRTHEDVLRYVRFEENQGFTANLLQAVDAARGDFCWLFSSDDAVAAYAGCSSCSSSTRTSRG